MLNDPNADPQAIKALATRVNDLNRKNAARNTKISLIKQYIKAHGLPNRIEDLPDSLQDTAKEILEGGGVLNNGMMTPGEVSEIGKRIREYSAEANTQGTATIQNEMQQA